MNKKIANAAVAGVAAVLLLGGCGSYTPAGGNERAKEVAWGVTSSPSAAESLSQKANKLKTEASRSKAYEDASRKARKEKEKAKSDKKESKVKTQGSEAFEVKSKSDTPGWATAVNTAQEHLGKPYLWGGNGTPEQDGRFDCSGLTKWAYAQAGIELPRVANDQYATTNMHPRKEDLRPGDLVFYGLTERGIHHVGIYVGGNHMIHAPRTGRVISFDRIDYMEDYFGATRVVE